VSQNVSPDLPLIDSLWNYNDPAESELKFRALLPKARSSGNEEYVAQLLTQVARAQGLQQSYDAAHRTLDDADALIAANMTTARARSLLERGRVLNSAGTREQAIPLFKAALDTALDAGLEYYAVDAAHMLGIATKGDESLHWNEQAIRLAEAAKDARARRWLGPLYNNTGWTYADMGRYEDGLRMFERDFQFRTAGGNAVQIGIARWSIAKMLRHLGRVQEALKHQFELLEDPARKGNDAEGYTREEIGECLLLLGRSEDAEPEFARAWELLKDDPWLRQDEPQRLARLKRLGRME